MSVILAIEPDSAQADVLRRSVPERVGGELVLVTTTSAALAEIGKRVPDVLLFGRSITKKDQDAVVAQARTSADDAELLTFVIPELRGAQEADRPKTSSRFGFWKRPAVEADLWDPVLFAEQIATSIGKVEGARRKLNGSAEAATTPPPAEVAQWDAPRSWEGDQQPATGARESWVFDDRTHAHGPATHGRSEPGEPQKVVVGVVAGHSEDIRAGEMLAAELVKIRREAEEKLNLELARVRAEAEQTLEETAALALESDRARQDAEARLEQELTRLREQTEQLRQETEQARREEHTVRDAAMMAERVANQEAAAQALDAEVARVRAETEARFEAELARVREHAEQARLAQEQAQRDSESIRDTAARALEAEVARVRAEAEARLDAELVRVREQAEQARLAHEQTKAETDTIRGEAAVAARTAAEEATARALEAEVARVRAEAEARFEAELAQAREQANQMRLAHEQARRDTDTIRDAAAEAARVAAEEAAARALEAEVMRVRAEAEARFETELARLREDQANQAQLAHEQARRETDTIRDAAAHAARTAAEQAAAKALEGEVSRVRAETEARFEDELARVREQAEQMRLAQEQAWRDNDAAREQAARAARIAAEESATSALQVQLARVTADTQARLEQELARVREEADQAREAQHEAQAEMARLREQAGREARAAAQAAVAEATRNKNINTGEIPQWERDRRIISDGVATPWYADEQPAEEEQKSWLGLWTVAATVLLVAAVSFALGVPASLMSGSAGWLTGMGVGSAPVATTEAAPVPVAAAPAPRRAAPRRPAAAEAGLPPAVEIIKESGFVSVFSRLPLEIYADGQRLGTTEDGQLLLPPGQHTLEVVNDQFNFRTKIPVNIVLGEVTSHTVTMPLAGLRVVTSPGAEIWVEGAMLGKAPLQDLPIQIGTREVMVRHPELGERRGTIEVKLGQTAEVNLMLDGSERPSAPPTLAPLSAPPAPRPN